MTVWVHLLRMDFPTGRGSSSHNLDTTPLYAVGFSSLVVAFHGCSWILRGQGSTPVPRRLAECSLVAELALLCDAHTAVAH